MNALIKCGSCEKMIAPSAKACPGCGAPAAASANSPGRVIARIIAFLLIIAGFGSVAAMGQTENKAAVIGMASVGLLGVAIIAATLRK